MNWDINIIMVMVIFFEIWIWPINFGDKAHSPPHSDHIFA